MSADPRAFATPEQDLFLIYLERVLGLVEQELGPESVALTVLRGYRQRYENGETKSKLLAGPLYNEGVPKAELRVFEERLFGMLQRLWPPCDTTPYLLAGLTRAVSERVGASSLTAQRLGVFCARVQAGEDIGVDVDSVLYHPTPVPDHEAETFLVELETVSRQVCTPPPLPKLGRRLP